MTWPWISRASADIAIDAERRRADDAIAHAAALRAQNADLLARLTTLKLQGAVEVQPQQPTREPKEADPLTDAILARSLGDPRKRAMMLQQLRRDRAAGKEDMEILAEIQRGVQVDGPPE